jgi:hypothetical protein
MLLRYIRVVLVPAGPVRSETVLAQIIWVERTTELQWQSRQCPIRARFDRK